MLTRLIVDNFKSLQQLDMSFTSPLTVFIGTNSVGKSTVLQAIDLLPYLVGGDVQNYLNKRNWHASELRTQPYIPLLDLTSKKIRFSKRVITFTTYFHLDDGANLKWDFTLMPKGDQLVCTKETITDQDNSNILLNRDTKRFSWYDFTQNRMDTFPEMQLDSSMLSLINLNDESFAGRFPQLFALKSFISAIKSFDLLAPEKMRKTSRYDANDLGVGGERLAAFIHSMTPNQKEMINTKVKQYFPFIDSLITSKKQYGYVQLKVNQKFSNKPSYQINANYLSDGLLRIIAIISLGALGDKYKAVLLDEIEDGINPNLAAELVDYLKELGEQSRKQLFVTTHSPIVLNYFDKESIIFLWRDKEGVVKAQNMFSSPELLKQLDFMNPGEIWLNYDQEEIEAALTAIDPESTSDNEGNELNE